MVLTEKMFGAVACGLSACYSTQLFLFCHLEMLIVKHEI